MSSTDEHQLNNSLVDRQSSQHGSNAVIERLELIEQRLASSSDVVRIIGLSEALKSGLLGENSVVRERYFFRSNLSGANLSKAYLCLVNLEDADLSRADLSFANLGEARLIEADLREANLSGTNLSKANLSGVSLNNANLTGANLTRANLDGADLSNVNLKNALLNNIVLKYANLECVDLFKAYLSNSDLSKANFCSANLKRANLTGANLDGANLTEANLTGANLDGANLTEVNLTGANLTGANLTEVNLTGANLYGANLYGANLYGANLTEANLEETNLTGTQLDLANTVKNNVELIFDTVVRFFQEDKWGFYQHGDEPFLRIDASGENGEYTCNAIVNEEAQRFLFYSLCPIKPKNKQRLAIAEYLTRANFGLQIGNFELDFVDGEIRYKTSIDIKGGQLSLTQIETMVYLNVSVMDMHLPGIIAVIYGEVSPKQAFTQLIEQIEDEDEDDISS
jgi:uncharacterized protein YjbI with pentapeptide repeats